MKLIDLEVDIKHEEDDAGFMGFNLERDEETGLLKMKEPDLINNVISAVGLDNGMDKGKYTPAGSVTLVNNEYCVPFSVNFNYISALGIMIYLSGHTRPYIDFEFNFCTRYMF